MKDKLTILVPLKDRSEYTKRFMSKSNDKKCPFKILLADGGGDVDIENHLKEYANYPNLNYEYFRCPFDSTFGHFYKKMKNAVDKIETPYICSLDNDDWFEVDGMTECVSILDKENYSSARGSLCASDGSNIWSTYRDDITGNTGVDRIIDQSKHFHSNWHNVMHTKIAKICWSIIEILNPTNFRFVEQINCYIPVVFGNSHRGDFPWVHHRRGERIETENGSLANHFPDQKTWITSNYWPENFNKMTEAVGVVISYVDNISVYEAMEKFRSAYPYKLPHLSDLLTDRINYAKSLGYNKERIDKMKEIVHQYSV